ncbi:MAG TPA: hypothetical protein DDY20_08235 [Desulfobulbaceae bacterium]|nr:hypothetical protein [Desulfobulbaceae bacterium]
MGKIIQLDTSTKRPRKAGPDKRAGCEHKEVVAYTVYRTVRCSICGTELDPFDVLLDILKGYIPPGPHDAEERKLLGEVEKRRRLKSEKKRTKFWRTLLPFVMN